MLRTQAVVQPLFAVRRLASEAAPPNKMTYAGLFEDTSKSIDEIEKTLSFPVTVIGTRKPHRTWFFAWDLNFAFIRDFLNPHFFLTFEDAKGKVVGPVCYRGNVVSWGPKFELSTRNMWGSASSLQGLKFDNIPKSFDVSGGGFDGGFSYFVFSRFRVGPGVVNYFGFSNVYGFSIVVGGGSFQRLPYLFHPSWGFKQWLFILAWNSVWFALCFVLFLAALKDEEDEEKN
eukprot:TRINITY_DN4939_c0_g2_i3.p1 TRINITY_DN4939_c0_g2~~TRINITY_DN4939_c0_g2_i3.p1  ORF type:complete len:230 (-),score=38.28 TRINITY_DN4939_c0_g2_i3:217-906(-)